MLKSGLSRAISGFCYAVAINLIIFVILILVLGRTPLLPEYIAKFDSEAMAILIELFLIGLMSAVLAGGTVIFTMEKIGLITQSIIYFILSSAVWIPVGCYCFGLNKYKQTMVSFTISYVGSYIICWIIQYRSCKKSIAQINQRLLEINQNKNEQ